MTIIAYVILENNFLAILLLSIVKLELSLLKIWKLI